MGLHRYFPDAEIVGVDIRPQKNYPFIFEQADAMTYPLDGFDFIWASPPCQGYTTMNNRHGRAGGLVSDVRGMLERQRLYCDGPHWIIENVAGAVREMLCPITLCGSAFHLGVQRHRIFDASFAMLSPGCSHLGAPVAVYGAMDGRRLWTRKDGTELRAWRSVTEAQVALGIDWMDEDGLRQAIPPAYSEYLAQFIPVKS